MQFSSTGKSSAPTEFVWVKSSLEVSTGNISYLHMHVGGDGDHSGFLLMWNFVL